MWRYFLAGFLVLIGFFEIVLSLNTGLREEVLKNSPLPLSSSAPWFFFIAGLSAFGLAAGILFLGRIF